MASVRSARANVTERRPLERDRARTEERLRLVLELNERAASLGEMEIQRLCLDAAVRLTDSDAGFLFEWDPDRQGVRLRLQTGTAAVARGGSGAAFADLWARCASHRGPVLHNAGSPSAGGGSDERLFQRHLSVPAFDGTEMKLLFVLAGKTVDYDQLDAVQAQLIASYAEGVVLRRRSEKALRDTELRLGHLARGLGAILWEADLDPLRVTFVSDQAESMLGYPVNLWTREDEDFWTAHVHPEDREQVLARLAEGAARAADFNLEYRFVAADGRVHWLEDAVRVVCGESGRPVALHGLTIEVTKSKEAERTALESRAQLAAVIDSAMDAIVSVEAQGRVVVFNDAAETMFGVSAEEAIGSPVERFIPHAVREAHRGHVSAFTAAPRLCRLTLRGLRADGSTFPAEASLSGSILGGRSISTMVLRDISERVHVEQEQQRLEGALRGAAAQWTRTFDSLDSGIVIVDSVGNVKRLNRAAAQFARREPAECVGCHLNEFGPGEPWLSALALIGRIRPGGEGAAVAPVRDASSGRWWDLAATPLETADEAGTILLVRDVTAFVRLQESARRDEQMAVMGRLTSGVAHEVRNPLFAISANVDALGVVLDGNQEVRELVEAVRLEVKRVNALMVDLLQYGRPCVPVLTDTTAAAVIELAVQFIQPRALERHVLIRRQEVAPDHAVRVDRERLAEAIENILENAVQHSPAGGEVTVELTSFEEAGRTWARCAIGDRGPGFQAEDLAQAFEPFFTRRRGGTGLGLSIAQKTVAQHGGRVQIENRRDGGALVCVELPCLERAAVVDPESQR